MSFGKPATPTPQPEVKVPTPDDPAGIEAQRKAAIAAKGREGSSAYLLSGEQGVTGSAGTESKGLLGGHVPAKTQ